MGVWGRVQGGVRLTEEPFSPKRGRESELLIMAVDADFKHVL